MLVRCQVDDIAANPNAADDSPTAETPIAEIEVHPRRTGVWAHPKRDVDMIAECTSEQTACDACSVLQTAAAPEPGQFVKQVRVHVDFVECKVERR